MEHQAFVCFFVGLLVDLFAHSLICWFVSLSLSLSLSLSVCRPFVHLLFARGTTLAMRTVLPRPAAGRSQATAAAVSAAVHIALLVCIAFLALLPGFAHAGP